MTTATFRKIAACLAAAACLLPSTAQASERAKGARAAERVVIADGHVDIGPRLVDGRWTIQVRDDTVRPQVWRNTEDVVLHAVEGAKAQVPDGPRFSFLGSPGSPVWVLPQVQQPGVLWPGWNTQDPQVTAVVNREVTWRLRRATGPGRFVLFVNGEFGAPEVIFDGSRSQAQQTGIDLNTHAHGNWAFSAPGTYLLDIEMNAQTTEGEQLSDRRLLRVFVGPGSANAAFDVPPPPGFTAGGTTTATERGTSGEGVPLWVWLTGGGAVAMVVIALTIGLRQSRRTAAGSTETGQET